MAGEAEQAIVEIEDIEKVFRESGVINQTLSEEKAKQIIPSLLLSRQENVSAPNLSSAIKITEEGEIIIENGILEVDNPQFKGTITVSAIIFNQPGFTLAAKDIKPKAEGGNFLTRPVAEGRVKSVFKNLQASICEGLGNEIGEISGGKCQLERFEAEIKGGQPEERGLRLLIKVTQL